MNATVFGGSNTRVRFFWGSRPIPGSVERRPVEMIEIRFLDDDDNIRTVAVDDRHRKQYAAEYARFQARAGDARDAGRHPLDEWPAITEAQREILREHGVWGVDKVAGLDAATAFRLLGEAGREIIAKAGLWVRICDDQGAMAGQLYDLGRRVAAAEAALARVTAERDELALKLAFKLAPPEPEPEPAPAPAGKPPRKAA